MFIFLIVLTLRVPCQKKEGEENILALVPQNPKGFQKQNVCISHFGLQPNNRIFVVINLERRGAGGRKIGYL